MTQTATIPIQESKRYLCESAGPGDIQAIRELLQQAMPGKVSFAMTHGPNHHAAINLASERVDEVVVRDRSKPEPGVVGYGYRAVRSVYLNGSVARVGYLGGLRCEQSLRAAFRVLGSAFNTLAAKRASDETPYDLTSIMADNTVVRRGIEKDLPGLPAYVPIGEMVTLTIQAKRHGRLQKHVRSANVGDTEMIQGLLDQIGPGYQGRQAWQLLPTRGSASSERPLPTDYLIFDNTQGHQGCIALWDQRALKQIVIADLAPSLGRLRHAINLAAFTTGRPLLPGPGNQLDMAYASHGAFDLEDDKTATALIAGTCAIAAKRGIPLVSIGLPANAPVLTRLVGQFKPWVSPSVIYAVSPHPESIKLDDRPVWMEVATL